MTRMTILLCTRNGARWLPEQLDSYLAQTDDRWDLWVSDDGSTDDTRAVLQQFAGRVAGRHAVRLFDGPRRGLAENYLSLLTRPDLPPGPVTLSDQDDVWFPGKLTHARAGLSRGGTVTIYGARVVYTDAGLVPFGTTPRIKRPPGFVNALTQNVVSGNTLTLSPAAVALVRRAGMPQAVPYHDWWLYQLVSGAGGDVVIGPEKVLFYRQHGANAMGAHRGMRASLTRAAQVLGRTYRGWIAANLAALRAAEDCLLPEHRALIDTLSGIPRRPGLARPRGFARAGLYRQGRLSTAALYLAAALGRV